MNAKVVSVSSDDGHRFSKSPKAAIDLIAGLGVAGDAHAGTTVKHRSRVAADPTKPNLRQVHLIHSELFSELEGKGFSVGPADLGENITTAGVDLLQLPRGTLLHVGPDAVVEITGLRNPCQQIEGFKKGLLAAVLEKSSDGKLVKKAGIMGVVKNGGRVAVGDRINVEFPPGPHCPLEGV